MHEPGYAELHCRSNFSFLQGASHPEELVEEALLPRPEQEGFRRAVAQYADLGIDLSARLELRFDELRNARCSARSLLSVSRLWRPTSATVTQIANTASSRLVAASHVGPPSGDTK